MFEPIEATWTFSEAELQAHWAMLVRRAGAHRGNRSHGAIVTVLVVVSCVAAAALAPRDGLVVGFICFVVVMLFWTAVYWLSKIGERRVARAWVREIAASGPEAVEITQTHLRLRYAGGGIDTKIDWSRVLDVGSAGAALTIWLNAFQAIMIPKRVFQPSEIDRILALWSSVERVRTRTDPPGWLVRNGGAGGS